MKNLILSLTFVAFIVFSCNEKKKKIIQIDYPKIDQSELKEGTNFNNIKLEEFTIFKDITNKVDSIICADNIPRIELNLFDTIKRIEVISFCSKDFIHGHFKQRNVIEIHNDTIYKNDLTYSIDSLYHIMKKDYQNNRKESSYADSPKKLIISISYPNNDINALKRTLNQITKNYEKINTKGYLNIELIEREKLEIIEIPPPPELQEIELIEDE